MILYLTAKNVLAQLATRYGPAAVRDRGLLESAVARPQASAGGEDAYPTLHEKVAALFHSLAKNHALVDGNKRCALLATKAMLDINGWEVNAGEWELFDLVQMVADGRISEVSKIAELLLLHSKKRSLPQLDLAD